MKGWLGLVSRVIFKYDMTNLNFRTCEFHVRNGIPERRDFDLPIQKQYTYYTGQSVYIDACYEPELAWVKEDRHAGPLSRSRRFQIKNSQVRKSP
jgi:hypothetical protein